MCWVAVGRSFPPVVACTTLLLVTSYERKPMVQSSTMTAVMAEKDPPVFRDFLGIGRKDEAAVKQQSQLSAGAARGNSAGFEDDGEAEMSTKASSGTSGRFENSSTPGIPPPFSTTFPPISEPGSGAAEGWMRAKGGPGALQHHGVKSAFYKPETENKLVKRRDSPIGRESLQERLQMSVEALENSRPQKLARIENKDDKVKIRSAAPSVDELRLGMQPPRHGVKGLPLVPTAAPKPEFSSRLSKKPERPRPHLGAAAPGRLSQHGMSSERPSPSLGVEHDMAPAIAPPAADEGSRTGMKGSPLGGLLNSVQPTQATTGVSSGPSSHIAPRRPKVSSHSGVANSMISARHQFTAPPSRQLTIFYGGQAHVFDEVPPDKANQIMQLAGSSGRSWSTTYSAKQTTSVANSASEESLSVLERDRDRIVNISQAGPSQNGVNLAISTEVQTLLRGLAQSNSGAGSAGLGHPLPGTSVSPLPSEMQLHQTLPDRIAANGNKRDSTNGRTVTRQPSCTDDTNGKDTGQGGQRWMEQHSSRFDSSKRHWVSQFGEKLVWTSSAVSSVGRHSFHVLLAVLLPQNGICEHVRLRSLLLFSCSSLTAFCCGLLVTLSQIHKGMPQKHKSLTDEVERNSKGFSILG
ncbi:hypothetical protein R1flu_027330 [Riccia fluitans]|uniref:Tify domain-containing protein n=1 Tax=Riccia fluitans TaxID=41844 RepID=A0ABD1XIH3_9MARC